MDRRHDFVRAIAVFSVASVCLPVSAAEPIWGGPLYNEVTGMGFHYPTLPRYPGSTAGNGVGIGVGVFSVNAPSGFFDHRAVRWDADGWVELGRLASDNAGTTNTWASAVNESGVAVGFADMYVNGRFQGRRAVRWNAATSAPIELGNLGTASDGFRSSWANAINAAGTSVGRADKFVNGSYFGDRAVRWDASGRATELGFLEPAPRGQESLMPFAINPSGAVVGAAAKWADGLYFGLRAVRWDAEGTVVTELDSLGTTRAGHTNSIASSINALGDVVGQATKYVNGISAGERAVCWRAGTISAIELGHLGLPPNEFTDSSAYGVNDHGIAVGYAQKFVDGVFVGTRAVCWDISGSDPQVPAIELEGLGTNLYGFASSFGYSINAAGITVGSVEKCVGGISQGFQAVYWHQDGSVVDLNSLLSPEDAVQWKLTEASSISDTGWITGAGLYDHDGGGPLAGYRRLFLMRVSSASDSCPADFNGDDFVDFFDYSAFVSCFEGGVCPPEINADQNGDGFVDFFDYDQFVYNFEIGC